MLKLYTDFRNYTPWSGAVDTYNEIDDAGKLEALEDLLEELYPDGIDETQLNDLLWFDSEWVLNSLGVVREWQEEFTIIREDTGEIIHIEAEIKDYDEALVEVDLYIRKPDNRIKYVENILMCKSFTVESYIHDEAGENILMDIYETNDNVEG